MGFRMGYISLPSDDALPFAIEDNAVLVDSLFKDGDFPVRNNF